MGGYRNIIPLKQFKADIDGCLATLHEGAQPLVITRHGRGLFVVQLPDSYDQIESLANDARHQHALQIALDDAGFDERERR